MSFTILDGRGTGKEASVDTNNRLLGNVLIDDLSNHASDHGQRYNINTGSIELTSANESAVLYFKNNEDSDYVINRIIYNLGASTSGVGEAIIDVFFNTTGGTIITTGPTDVDINVNQNLGSSNTLNADAFKGAEARTQTGGILGFSSLILPGLRTSLVPGKLIVPKGKTIAVTITPPTSNTSMNVQIALSGYLATPTVTGNGN